jgi:hypothetical protein
MVVKKNIIGGWLSESASTEGTVEESKVNVDGRVVVDDDGDSGSGTQGSS